MEFGLEIIIKNKIFKYVDTQRDGISAIYKNESSFLRIGNHEKISKDLASHKNMESLGFPVSKLLDEGVFEGMDFFIEESLGEKTFGHIFKEEMKNFGKIKDETFDQFISICVKFADAQIKTAVSDKNWDDFEVGVHLDLMYKELPDQKDKIKEKWEKVKNNISVFPFATSHGDFTAFNIFPKGIIDLENSFLAPVGYDIGTIIEHLNWFPKSNEYELYRLYDYTEEQKQKLSSAVDEVYTKNGLPKISIFLKDFDFVRGLWFTARMKHMPKLQKYRYDIVKNLIK